MTKITVKGTIKFDPVDVSNKQKKQSTWKRTAMIILKDDTCAFYSWIIQNRFHLKLNTPMRGAHITIINDKYHDQNKWEEIKKKWDGVEIEATYEVGYLRTNAEHWWFRTYCETGDQIRKELGLGDPFFDYHLTIGYVPKEHARRFEDSQYILRTILRYNL